MTEALQSPPTIATREPVATAGRRAERASAAPRSWAARFVRILVCVDVVAIAISTTAASLVPSAESGAGDGDRAVVAVVTAVLWLMLLAGSASRSPRVVGTGATEYRRVVESTVLTFGLVALGVYLLDIEGLRLFLGCGFGAGVVLLLAARWSARRWLIAQRRQGRMSRAVLLVGSPASIATVARDVQRTPAAGFRVVGAAIPGGAQGEIVPGTTIPVRGRLDNLPAVLQEAGVDTVIVTSSNEFSSSRVRELSWQLEPGRQHLVVAPSLTDIGGPRLHTRPVNGLPLIHVETPHYEGWKQYAKRAFDIVCAGLLIVALSPLLAVVTVLVRASSPGPVLFRQERVGLRGGTFRMLKFRSMYEDAEARLAELVGSDAAGGNGVMFKMKDDPRVTPVGRVLRRFSIDELPQLFNVLLGSMSLVGPRPPLEREVAQYSEHVYRRFLVKPGITGLWQVSGRSDLDWDETVRLDLFYVENWTMWGDLFILWKTARAVVFGAGAY
ncbi:sugar transferase [Microbacterium sp. NPDC055683]